MHKKGDVGLPQILKLNIRNDKFKRTIEQRKLVRLLKMTPTTYRLTLLLSLVLGLFFFVYDQETRDCSFVDIYCIVKHRQMKAKCNTSYSFNQSMC